MGPVLLLLALLAAACAGVRGNTEIRHFRPSAGGHAHPSQRVLDLVAAAIPNQAVLAGPYTISGIEEVAPAGSAIAGDAAKARWYRLQGLEPGRSYEVRISYAASTPADFGIALYTVAEIMDRHGIALDDRGAAQDGVTMYARVTATYTGVR
ncbi:hypothetical protein H4R18_004859 [Coemansia javaensis]|uniref:Uncharacterized protein n=1 Tax=Coemansia javaensis TaxID=2761396 RepID=A0A9W8H6Q3_9FUNG|nr:hypothetical protein H4R18_004859 [Coemansia javaensis]